MLKRSLKRKIQKLRSRRMGKRRIRKGRAAAVLLLCLLFAALLGQRAKSREEGAVLQYGVLAELAGFENQAAWEQAETEFISAQEENGGEGENTAEESDTDEEEVYLEVSYVAGNAPDRLLPELDATALLNVPGITTLISKRYEASELRSLDYLVNHFYIVDSSTIATAEEFNVESFVEKDLRIEKDGGPKILIYHTHGSEAYIDSRTGVTEDTVIGVGEVLAKELRETYGYEVMHHTAVFDKKADGSGDRDNAYNNALPEIKALLTKHPTIEVVIDLHRDSGEARVTEIDGIRMARVMLFNGLCRTKKGPIEYYSNPNLETNLAFSFQMNVVGNEMYPGLMHRIYLKSYRYNMHLCGRYLLIELGTEKNTVQEAKNAMKPLAAVLNQVLTNR